MYSRVSGQSRHAIPPTKKRSMLKGSTCICKDIEIDKNGH